MTKKQGQYQSRVFSNSAEIAENLHAKKKKKITLDTDLPTFTSINSKWIINQNVKLKILRILKDNLRENLHDLKYGNDFSSYKIKGMIH